MKKNNLLEYAGFDNPQTTNLYELLIDSGFFRIKEFERFVTLLVNSRLKIKKKSLKVILKVPIFMQYKYLKKNMGVIKTKSLINKICRQLEPIARYNGNRFIFRTLDVDLYCREDLFCRLILNLSYLLILYSEQQCAIDIISYLEDEKFVIEFITINKLDDENQDLIAVLATILEEIKGEMSYEKLNDGQITFKLTMPYGNIHS